MKIFNSDIRNTLKKQFLDSIRDNFSRKAVTSCSLWAEKYRVVKGVPWKFDRFPWLRDMHDSSAQFNIGQKASQMGYTETILNICFYNVDIRSRDVLYVLPSRSPDASVFSASRFDPAVEDSEHLTKLFSNVKNVHHKRASSGNVYIRGARSRGGLKSVPTGVVILDEVNEMPPENIPLAFERASGQEEKNIWLVSTPTVESVGISLYYSRSSQNHYYFKCPSCSRYIELIFPESMVMVGDDPDDPRIKESHYICTECKAIIHHENKVEIFKTGRWIETVSNKDDKGWHINHLYSTVIKPYEITKKYFLSMTGFSFEQEFYNSDLGVTHEVGDARVTDAQIESARGNYTQVLSNDYGTLVTLGADVGFPYIHFEIDEWMLPRYGGSFDINTTSKCRVLRYGKIKEFEELDDLMKVFQVRFGVIDAQPEKRKALEFANRFWGRVRLAFYGNGVAGKSIHVSDKEDPTLTVDRTSWLDLSLGRFRNGTITLPSDIDFEYKEHLKAPVRIYKDDKTGNPIGTYINSKADHYAHARNYAEIALPLAVSIMSSQSIENVL